MPGQNVDLFGNDDIGTIVVRSTVNFTRNYPKVTAAYVIGLSVLIFATGYAVDSVTQRRFDELMYKVEKIEYGELEKAHLHKNSLYDQYYYSKGWFTCDHTCTNNYNRYLQAEEQYRIVAEKRDKIEHEARKTVGIFSQYGVDACRRQFWAAWERGKAVAKRMSWWDTFFIGMRSTNRDEDGIVTIIRILGQVLMNFTIGLCVHVTSFAWSLIWFVRTFDAGLNGALFFALAMCAVFAVLVSYLLGMAAVFTGGSYALVKYSNNAALRNGQAGGRGNPQYRARRVQGGRLY